RTLASLATKPVAIGVGYEMARMKSIVPQRWDVPMDWVVTERGVYRRDPEGLAFLGEAFAGVPSPLASPVCYMDEIAPAPQDDDSGPSAPATETTSRDRRGGRGRSRGGTGSSPPPRSAPSGARSPARRRRGRRGRSARRGGR